MGTRLDKTCPKCSKGTTVKRINKSTGTEFVGCDQFPDCKYSKDWNPKTRRRIAYWPTHKGMDIDEQHEMGFGNCPEDAGFY